MLQFSKLLLVISLIAMIYSIYGMNLEQESVVFYLGVLIASITVFVLSVGIYTINFINRVTSQRKNSSELKH